MKRQLTRRQILALSIQWGMGSYFAHKLISPARAHARGQDTDPTRLSYKAFRGTDIEGPLQIKEIEGKIPPSLRGTLYRVGPGTKNNYGSRLDHLFDGDALISKFHFLDGQVSGQNRFIDTAERKNERSQNRMLYHEFGTACPQKANGYKNPPNINILPWGDELLALSESTAPVLLKAQELETLGIYNFEGQFPNKLTFTAHPKVDPLTGDIYGFGISQGLSPQLKTFRVAKGTSKITWLNEFSLGGFYPIHDFVITKNYMCFVIAPLKINLFKAARGKYPIADIIEYDNDGPLRFLILAKNGDTRAHVITDKPGGIIFHHANAFEDETTKHIFIDSVWSPDHSAYATLAHWGKKEIPQAATSWLTRFQVDLGLNKVVSRKPLSDGIPLDFPTIDERRLGGDYQFVHTIDVCTPEKDPLAFNQISRWDLKNSTVVRARASDTQVFGEPLFVADMNSGATESDGWLVHLGYEVLRDETFIDIRHTIDLSLQARIWLGRYLPLGFHGHFVAT